MSYGYVLPLKFSSINCRGHVIQELQNNIEKKEIKIFCFVSTGHSTQWCNCPLQKFHLFIKAWVRSSIVCLFYNRVSLKKKKNLFIKCAPFYALSVYHDTRLHKITWNSMVFAYLSHRKSKSINYKVIGLYERMVFNVFVVSALDLLRFF